MRTSIVTSRYVLLAWVIVCATTVLGVGVPRGRTLTAAGDFAQCLLLLLVTFSMFANTRAVERRVRLFWLLMMLGSGIWLSAQLLWTYFEAFQGQDVPNPFVGDVILFLHLVPMMGALAIQPHRDREDAIPRLGVLDFTLLLVWWLYLYLFFVIPWQFVYLDPGLYGKGFDVAYFTEHVAFLVVLWRIWRRSTDPWRRVYGHLFGAALLYAFASIAASVAIDFGRYYTGSIFDLPLIASMAWFATAGFAGRTIKIETQAAKQSSAGRSSWVSRLAMGALLSLPLLMGWAINVSDAPMKVKSFRLSLTIIAMLVMGVLVTLKQHRLDRELDRAYHELQQASLTDILTGVRNRRFLATTIEADVGYAIRSHAEAQHGRNRDLVFYLIDADHFKEINDRYGHDLGDKLLIEIVRRISSAIRNSDVLIRWGGEEFLVLSRYTNRNDAAALAMRVLAAVGGEAFELDGDILVRRTCSIGWAVFPWFIEDPQRVSYEEVLRLADRALYQAKEAGRNQAVGMVPASTTWDAASNDSETGRRISDRLHPRTIVTPGPQILSVDSPATVVPTSR